jgi:hypothetical protein
LFLMFLPVIAAAQPSIVSVVPNSANRGDNVGVQITGQNTVFQQDSETTSIVWLSQGASRIDGTNVNVASATSLTATFPIPTDAPFGLWDVNVEQVGGAGTVTLVGGFTILGAVCSITDLAAGTQSACDPATNTYTQEVVVTFENAPATGNLTVNGQTFTIGTSPQTVTLTGLTSDGAAVDVTASFSAEPGCSRTETALFTAPASCAVNPCSISDLAPGAQTGCTPETNTYTQEVIVTFANPPATGSLVVNGQSFTIGTSPQTVTLINLPADGLAVDVTANFSATPECSRTETALFTAPASCAVNPCSISDLAPGTQTGCDPASNTYTQEVIVTFANPPATGNLVVNGQSFAIGTSPQTVTLTNLPANGLAVDVTANFSADTGCSRTETALFTAPASCGGPVCSITDLAPGAQTACNPATNTYTQEVIVTFENPPSTGNLVVNNQSFSIGTSPQTVTLTNLTANGNPVNVTARFSAQTGCSRTENALFTAPASCGVVGGLDCSDAEASRETLWPPNHQFKTVRIEGIEDDDDDDDDDDKSAASPGAVGVVSKAGDPATLDDDDDDDDDIQITITGVTSDEPVGGNTGGETCPDAIIHSDGTVDLRAERDPNGNGRVYTILFTATNTETGASCSDTVFVCVPHDARDHDDDDDDDDDKAVDRGDGGDHGGGRDRDRDHDHDGHRRHHDRDRDHEPKCVRDAEQFDATVCSSVRVALPSPTPQPIVTRVIDQQLAIQFTSPASGPVDLKIYDLRGRLVRSVTGDYAAGAHELKWDGRDSTGHMAASGIYLVRLVTAGQSHTSKTVWIR